MEETKIKEIKLWIARDEIDYGSMDIQDSIDIQNHLERHPENEYIYSKLHIFYDRPCEIIKGKFVGARDIAEVPNYMFPEIKCGTLVELTGKIDITDY